MRGDERTNSTLDFSVIFTNIRSLIRKREDLCSVIDSCDADLIVLTETWLSAKICNTELFHCQKRYNIYRNDRNGKSGGGVLLAVADTVVSFHVPIACDLEIVWVCVCLNYKRWIFGVCYRPPTKYPTFSSVLHDCINQIILRFPGSPIVLMGDFNYPNIKWSDVRPSVVPFSTEASEFTTLCSDVNLVQLVTSPTRVTSSSSSVLDLILTTHPDSIPSVSYLPGLSDHSMLHFTLHVLKSSTLSSLKSIRDYSKADFISINRELCQFLDRFLEGFFHRSVESNWNLFKATVSFLTNKYIPCKKIRNHPNAPWYNTTLKRLSNKKKRLFRSAKLNHSVTRWDSYRMAAEEYKNSVKNAKHLFFNNTLPSMLLNNPRQFWNTINGSDNGVVSLITSDGQAIADTECASVLNNVFAKSFSVQCNTSVPSLPLYNFLPMNSIVFDVIGISEIIDGLKISSTSGVDDINSKFLKNTKMYSSIILSHLFSQSLGAGIVPDDWRIGRVVPLHKSGDKHDPFNYRPISLTSVPCKILEHIICTHLASFLESNNFLTPAQHGFRKSFSCETQLVSFTHDLHRFLDCGSQTDCIFLDFSKAFDKVSHSLLIHKLRALNIDPHVLDWIVAFLTNRSQFVSVNNNNSSFVSVDSGVPQGSVIGPLLFLIYINDLVTNISSSICLFADDCVLYRNITDQSDMSQLQNDLNIIAHWCNTWLMELNTSKCKSMRVSRSNTACPTYYIDNNALSSVSVYKYLGVHITSNLSWSTHVEYVANNANRMLGYLKRNFFQAPSSLKLILYKCLVRSKLEYASSVWDPGHQSLINTLEATQNRAARFILSNYHRTASVTNMKSTLSLPNLSSRRKHARLCLFHKIYHHNPLLRQKLILEPFYHSARLDHIHKVGLPNYNTNTFSASFITRTSNDWNHLPASIASITDISLFKQTLTNSTLG